MGAKQDNEKITGPQRKGFWKVETPGEKPGELAATFALLIALAAFPAAVVFPFPESLRSAQKQFI